MTTAQNILQKPWTKWLSQIWAVVRMDVGKRYTLRPQRGWLRRGGASGIFVYLMAVAPAVIIALHGAIDRSAGNTARHVAADTEIMAAIVQIYYIRLGVFFGCMGVFTWLVRGEVIEKTLHYYLLTPIRREVLGIGKFLGGLIASATIFGGGVLLCFALMYWHIGSAGRDYVFQGGGMSQLGSYLLVTVLACLGFGSVFFALSLVFKNPIVPAALLMGWETISGILPAVLQKLTITYYLKQLTPLELPQTGLMALFTVVAQPLPKAVAVLGLCLLSAAIVAFACLGMRRMEISYSVD
jgi:ABC-type transport system involved in multi-copper enzyme maturation permease subunit